MTKTMIITFWALLMAFGANAQSSAVFDLTGRNRESISEMAGEVEVKIEPIGEIHNGERMIFIVEDIGLFIADVHEGLCRRSIYVPATSSILRKLVMALNEEAIPMGKNSWKLYFDEGYVTDIDLSYYEDHETWAFSFEMLGTPWD